MFLAKEHFFDQNRFCRPVKIFSKEHFSVKKYFSAIKYFFVEEHSFGQKKCCPLIKMFSAKKRFLDQNHFLAKELL